MNFGKKLPYYDYSVCLRFMLKTSQSHFRRKFMKQDFLNGPVKDCVSQSYTDRFKTKHRFITKNANVAKLDSFIYCNP